MVYRRIKVSEKSLELNVGAELLECVRSWPGCQKALWVGLTQAQESVWGLDERIRNTPKGVSLMLQFKAPHPRSAAVDHYKFSINVRQHQVLLKLAVRFPDDVHYVFPLYDNWSKADLHAPCLALDTWLIPVSSMPSSLRKLQPKSANSSRMLYVRREGAHVTARTRSGECASKVVSVRDYCAQGRKRQLASPGTIGIPALQLQEWAQETDQPNLVSGTSRQRFTGLNAVFIP